MTQVGDAEQIKGQDTLFLADELREDTLTSEMVWVLREARLIRELPAGPVPHERWTAFQLRKAALVDALTDLEEANGA